MQFYLLYKSNYVFEILGFWPKIWRIYRMKRVRQDLSIIMTFLTGKGIGKKTFQAIVP
jgi:hypothetical protein